MAVRPFNKTLEAAAAAVQYGVDKSKPGDWLYDRADQELIVTASLVSYLGRWRRARGAP